MAVSPQIDETVKASLRLIYPGISIPPRPVSDDLAAWTLTAIKRLKFGSLATNAAFNIYGDTIAPTSLSSLGKDLLKEISKAVVEAKSSSLKWNLITYNMVIAPQRRNIEAHLRDPETFPCPDWR